MRKPSTMREVQTLGELRTCIETRLTRLNYGKMVPMSEDQMQIFLSMPLRKLRSWTFEWTSDVSKHFEWLFSQYAKFCGSTYNAVEIGYKTNLDPMLIASYIHAYGIEWAQELFWRKRLETEERGQFTVYNAGHWWTRGELEHLARSKTQYPQMQKRLQQVLHGGELEAVQHLGALLLALIDAKRPTCLFKDMRFEAGMKPCLLENIARDRIIDDSLPEVPFERPSTWPGQTFGFHH